MALTKYQRLARAIRDLLTCLDGFYDREQRQMLDVVQCHLSEISVILQRPKMSDRALNAMGLTHKCGLKALGLVQCHFYELPRISWRPKMSSRALRAMMLTHKCGLIMFAPDPTLRIICATKRLIGSIVTPPIVKISYNSRSLFYGRWFVPWGARVITPEDLLRSIPLWKKEAILYCSGEHEMFGCFDWFGGEDQGSYLGSQIPATVDYYKKVDYEQNILNCNLGQLALPHFEKIAKNYDLTTRSLNRVVVDLSMNDKATVYDAYRAVVASLRSRKGRHYESLKIELKHELEEIIFYGLNWTKEQQDAFIRELDGEKAPKIRGISGARWKTALGVDRAVYGSFIQYFAQQFLEDPIDRRIEGEITCFLWIAVWFAREHPGKLSLKLMLSLTTEHVHVEDCCICIKGMEVEVSRGLMQILQDYIGDTSFVRHQKIFPNLTVDNLEDHFHRASGIILPSGSIPATPGAFLTFPHNFPGRRLPSSMLRRGQSSQLELPRKFFGIKEIAQQLR